MHRLCLTRYTGDVRLGYILHGSMHPCVPNGDSCSLNNAAVMHRGMVMKLTSRDYRYNEVELRWVALQEWTFERQINVSEELLAAKQLDLLLSGVDTVADIRLNGEQLLSTDNAFR